MNQRIRELAEQCYHRYSEHNINLEKFAELIVRECANIVNSLEQYEGQGDCFIAEYIKEHFGVE